MIVGAPKSGTTWVENLLNGHPDVRCKSEIDPKAIINEIGSLVDSIADRSVILNKPIGSTDIPIFTDEELFYLLNVVITLLVTDNEMPDAIGVKGNVAYKKMDLLEKALPKCKFIQVIRDGRDAVTSTWYHNWRVDKNVMTDYSLEDFVSKNAFFWVESMKEMEEWREANMDRCLLIKYEDLIKDQEPIVEEICYFLNVSKDAKSVQLMIDGASFEKFADGRKPGMEDTGSFYRKGIVGDYKNFLSLEHISLYNNIAGDTLRKHGYET